MHIEIGEIESQVRAVDDRALVDPRTVRTLLREVLAEVREREAHDQRVRRERDVNAGRTTMELG